MCKPAKHWEAFILQGFQSLVGGIVNAGDKLLPKMISNAVQAECSAGLSALLVKGPSHLDSFCESCCHLGWLAP